MKKFLMFLTPLALVVATSNFLGCDELIEALEDEEGLLSNLGWLFEEEDTGSLEQDINFDNTTNLPSSVSLTQYLPPIGNQGQYGTCVAWAAGYNLKAALEAKDLGLSSSDLANTQYQFSPKDIFWRLPASKKPNGCDGTSFEAVMDVMISDGVATLASVPYSDLNDCQPSGSWTSDAAAHKIEAYRKIQITKNELKQYLEDGRPIVIGAKLGDRFMQWSDASVYDSDTYSNPGMQHAYHAMLLVGYDDSKGPNGSFRIVNSWGPGWGDNGFVWVDQNFFVSENFCFVALVAKNKPSGDYDPADDQTTSGTHDLIAWDFQDYDDPEQTDSRVRKFDYNVYNIGSSTLSASADWTILYIYYNAYDANEWGIFLYDYYTDDYGNYGEDGSLSSGPGASNWWSHIDLASQQSVAEAMGGNAGSYFTWGYTVPSTLNGDYFMTLIADGYNVVEEYDEANNYLYNAKENGDPYTFNNGVMSKPLSELAYERARQPKGRPAKGDESVYETPKKRGNVNSYSQAEIYEMIKYHKATGKVAEQAERWARQNDAKRVLVK